MAYEETTTAVLRFLRDTFQSNNYTINAISSQPIQFNGQK